MREEALRRAERYAASLLALAEATGSVDQIERDLGVALDLVEGHEEVRRFLMDMALRDEGRAEAVGRLLAGRVHPALLRFAQILAEERKLPELRRIAEAFYEALARQRNETAGELVAAGPLPVETVARIEEAVGAALNCRVRLRVRLSSDILAGVIVRVGDRVLDGTVDRRLEEIRAALVA